MSNEFREYNRALTSLVNNGIPRAVAETLTTVGGWAHYATAKNVRQRFTLRNQYTERSLRFYKASPKTQLSKINAVTGSISPYMEAQDAGGERLPKQGSRAPVATIAARGGNPSKVIRKKYYAGTMSPDMFVGRPGRGGDQPFGVWERYRQGKTTRVRMIRSLENTSVEIKATRWHRDGVTPYARENVFAEEYARVASRILQEFGAK